MFALSKKISILTERFFMSFKLIFISILSSLFSSFLVLFIRSLF